MTTANATTRTMRFQTSLTLDRKADTRSIYTSKVVIREHVDKSLIQAYLAGVDDVVFSEEKAKRRGYASVNQNVKKYLDQRYDTRKGYAKTKIRFPAHKWGRIVPTDNLSLSVMHKPTRHSFCKDRYIDIDMVNASQNILRLACQQRGIATPCLDEYCDNRDQMIADVVAYHGVDNDAAKDLFIAGSFGGSYNGWRRANQVAEDLPPMLNAKEIEDEYRTIIDLIYEANPNISTDIEKADPNKYDKYITADARLAARKRTCAATFYQTVERLMQETMIMHLVNERNFALEDIVPCQDGFMILKELYYDGIIEACEIAVADKFGFYVPLIVKPFNKAIVIPPMPVLPQITPPGTPTLAPTGGSDDESWVKKFREMVVEFEKTHSLIANEGVYAKETPDGVVVMTKQHLRTTYGNMCCGKSANGAPVAFIDKWTGPSHPGIRTYASMGVYPDADRCPDDVLNVWTPFAYERMGPEFTPNADGLARFIAHISILVGHEEQCKEHMLDWVAHTLQYPMEKSTCPVFISKQKGAGKSVFINKYLARIFGAAKLFETQTPSRDVWGSFNGMMASKFIVNLDELSRKESMESDGKLRGLITSPTITINQKGKPQYDIPSYHRFIVTTNHEEGGINSDNTERRYDIFRCSEEKCAKTDANRAYFRQLVEDSENDDVILTIVDALMQRNVERNFLNTAVVISSYQEELNEAARPAIEVWLEDFVSGYREDTVDVQTSEMFAFFTEWCGTHNFKCDGITSMKFGVRLNNLFRDGKENKYFGTRKVRVGTRAVNMKTVNIIGLKAKFGIL